MGMMGKMMEGIMAKASEKYNVVEIFDKLKEVEQIEMTLTEITYILMNSKIDKIVIFHRE